MRRHIISFFALHVCFSFALEPFSTVSPTTLGYTSVSRSADASPTSLWSSRKPPLQTNRWWENAVLGDGVELENNLMQFPYIVSPKPSRIDVAYPWTAWVDQQFQNSFDPIVEKLGISTTEALTGLRVSDETDLSITFTWGNSSSNMSVPIVRGAPFISALFANASPRVTVLQRLVSISYIPPPLRHTPLCHFHTSHFHAPPPPPLYCLH
jgi:endoglucanase Acf2